MHAPASEGLVARAVRRAGDKASARPILTFLLAALLVALAGLVTSRHIAVDTDSSRMLSDELPHRQREAALNAAFPGLNARLVVVIDAPDADSADLFAARLKAAIEKHPDLLEAPFVAALDPWFQRNGLLYMDDAALDSMLAKLSRAGPLLGTLAAEPTLSAYFASLAEGVVDADRIAGGEESLSRILLETDRSVRARLAGEGRPIPFSALFAPEDEAAVRRILTVVPKLDFTRFQPARPARDALDAAVAEARAAPGLSAVRVAVTGDPAMRSEELRSVTEGLGLALVVSLISVALLFAIAFRRLSLALVALSVVIVALALAAAFASLAFDALNLVSMAFAVLLTGLGADYAIHLILRMREPGGSWHAAADDLGLALFLCAVTTSLGFLAFVPTPFAGMAQLGLIGAFGVFAAFLAALFLVPAGLRLAGAGPPLSARSTLPSGLGRFAPWLVGALVALAALFAPGARFETDPMALRDPNAPSVVVFATLFDDKETRPYSASVTVADDAAAEALAARLKALPEVDHVVTPARLLPGEGADYRFEAVDAVAAGLLPQLEAGAPAIATENGLARLIEALEANPRPNGPALLESLRALDTRARADPAILPALERDILTFWPATLARLKTSLQPDMVPDGADLPAELVSRYRNPQGQVRVEVVPVADLRDPVARAAFVSAVRGIAPEAAGPVVNLEDSGTVVARAMVTATALALLACGLVLFAVTRNLPDTLATLAPVLAAIVLTLGASALLNLPFNYANVIALPMLLGAGIDSAIHMAARTRAAGAAAALSSSTPRAVLFSALTTVAAFGSLMLSAHRGVASIGALLLVALASTTICTLALQPAALALAGRLNARRTPGRK